MMNPTSVDMEDISSVFFDIISSATNMHYFNAQELAVDHCEEERDINRELP